MTGFFTLTKIVPANSALMYATWLSSDRFAQLTTLPASIEPWRGGQFEIYGGYVSGEILKSLRPKWIFLRWRNTLFDPEEHDALVEIVIEGNEEGCCKISIFHYEIPMRLVKRLRSDWNNYLFAHIDKLSVVEKY